MIWTINALQQTCVLFWLIVTFCKKQELKKCKPCTLKDIKHSKTDFQSVLSWCRLDGMMFCYVYPGQAGRHFSIDLILWWQRSLLYRNQFTDLLWNLMDRFLCDRVFRCEKAKHSKKSNIVISSLISFFKMQS